MAYNDSMTTSCRLIHIIYVTSGANKHIKRMSVKIFVVLLFFLPIFLFAQQRQYSTTDKSAIKYFALANQSLDENLYEDAIALLQKAIDADDKFIEAHFVLADVYRLMKQHKPAIAQYLKVIAIDPEFNHSVYLKVGDEEINLAPICRCTATS